MLIAIYVSSYEYIIDNYGENAAITLVSTTMMRYFIAGGMAMAARPMYEGIPGWGPLDNDVISLYCCDTCPFSTAVSEIWE